MAACTIVWFRRDLRLEDNPALIAAARLGTVIPVFVWSPEEEGQFYPGRVSRWWQKQSLIHLDATLRALGTPLIMRKARNTLAVLLEIIHATGANQVFYNHLYDPVSLVRDHKVKQGLGQHGVIVHTFNADLLYEPWEVYDDDGQAFTTFDAFWSKCLNMPFEPDPPHLAPKRLLGPPVRLASLTADELGLEDQQEKASNALLARAWVPGWSNADRALDAFLRGPLAEYAAHRSKADCATTSLLSPHMHFGEISARKIFHEARKLQLQWGRDGGGGGGAGAESVDMFLRAIGFREYSRYLSFNFPFTHERSLLANLKSFPWRVDEHVFKAWRQGRTGYPLIDAGMRELWATGWLHNRIRIMVSSFCVKFLQLPWRWGMKYFWDTLLDADLECDVLGWQYISGSLPDGHELDRMENPEVEGYKYDREGEYVRRWLPELSRVPTEWIHHPWEAPAHVLGAAGVEIGVNYPYPIVDVATARERLQEALSEMWEREAALKAAAINGVEEGLGETMEVPGTGGPGHERMQVHRAVVWPRAGAAGAAGEGGDGGAAEGGGEGVGGHEARAPRAHAEVELSTSSRRDQMVPTMPSERAQAAAQSILNRSYGPARAPPLEEGAQPPSPSDSSSDDAMLGNSPTADASPSPPAGGSGGGQGVSALGGLGGLGATSPASGASPSAPAPAAEPAAGLCRGARQVAVEGKSKRLNSDMDSTAESSAPCLRYDSRALPLPSGAVPVWSQSAAARDDTSPTRSNQSPIMMPAESLGVVPSVPAPHPPEGRRHLTRRNANPPAATTATTTNNNLLHPAPNLNTIPGPSKASSVSA
eukprot:jgi/Mesen1/1544/ME000134S00662